MASLKYFEGAKPGKKRKTEDKDKSQKNIEYESKRPPRKFSEKWLVGRPWLKFDEERNLMNCESCRQFYENDRQQQKSNSFIQGSQNFRLSTVTDHETSKSHKTAHTSVVHKGKSQTEILGETEAGKALSSLKEAERGRISLLIRNAHAIAKNNRPLTDFVWLCKIDMAKGLDIGTTYLNVKAAASFIRSIAETERSSMSKMLSEAPFFSFMMDGSTDIAGDEQETIYIRTSLKGNVTEKFLDIGSPNSTKSQDLFDHVNSVFEKHNIMKDKLIAMGSDGASNMVGKQSGLSTLLRENIKSDIVNVHCLCHRLELAFRDVIKPIKQYDKLTTLLIGLYYFYKKSYKNRQGLKRSIEAMKQGVYPTKVTGTRWLPHLLRAILAMMRTYNALEAHLSTASHENPKAEGLLKLMLDKQVMTFALFLKDALEPAMRLSLRLQKPEIVLGDSLCWVESTIELLTDKMGRTCPSVQQLLDNGEFSGISLKGPTPSTAFADKILKGFCEAIKNRFQTEAMNVLNASKILKFGNWPELGSTAMKEYGNEQISLVYQHFHNSLTRVQPNITEDRLLEEWSLLKKVISRKYTDETIKGLQWKKVFNEIDGIALIMLLVDLLLTIPSTSVSCETTFSQLKLLKTCRRSRLGPSVLNDLMMVKLQSPDISNFQPDSAVDNWMSTSTRKLTYKRAKRTIPSPSHSPIHIMISDEEEASAEPGPSADDVQSVDEEPGESEVQADVPDSDEHQEESTSVDISRQSYLSFEEELNVLCDNDKDFDMDAEDECFDFQSELSNFERLMDYGRE